MASTTCSLKWLDELQHKILVSCRFTLGITLHFSSLYCLLYRRKNNNQIIVKSDVSKSCLSRVSKCCQDLWIVSMDSAYFSEAIKGTGKVKYPMACSFYYILHVLFFFKNVQACIFITSCMIIR